MAEEKPLKFLIDESVELRLGEFLEEREFDIDFIIKRAPGSSDEKVISLAHEAERILITNDTDFGQLVFSKKLSHCGVILFRMKDVGVESKKENLAHLLEEHGQEIKGKYIVIEDERVRIRK